MGCMSIVTEYTDGSGGEGGDTSRLLRCFEHSWINVKKREEA